MSDYNATARTNYFRVKDLDALKKDLERHGISHTDWQGHAMGLIIDEDSTNKPEGSIALFSNDDHGTWPVFGPDQVDTIERAGIPCVQFLTDDDHDADECSACGFPKDEHELDLVADEYYVYDLPHLVSRHLVDGDVAVFIEVGAQKMIYLGGIAYAINSRGESSCIDLEDIYTQAAHLGTTITTAVN